MVKKIPTGKSGFDKVIDGNYYYVDKSDLIRRIIEIGPEVFLFTRPRRFGKSLNLSMLDCFFNLKYNGNRWFDGLKISEWSDCNEYKSNYPVIKIDFKGLALEYSTFISSIKSRVANIFMLFAEDLRPNLDDITLERFDRLYGAMSDEGELRESLLFLSILLRNHYKTDVIILIDEYDDPINKSYGKSKDSKKILDFMRSMLSSALKNNPHMRFGIVTGVMQIAKEDIFSGLNNLKVNNIFSKELDEMFGFTADEVRAICDHYGHPEKYEEARGWYDGYRFGNAEVYNPWSLLEYVSNRFTPGRYWAGTSGNDIVPDLIKHADDDTVKVLESLCKGESSVQALNEGIALANMCNKDSVSMYSVMAMTGYLNAIPDGSLYSISIPNKELYRVYGSSILSELNWTIPGNIVDFADSIIEGDADKARLYLTRIMMSIPRVRELENERSYHLFITGLLAILGGRYDVIIDHENGEGNYDILLKRIRGDGSHVLIEVKRVDSDRKRDPDSLAEAALEQIRSRSYAYGLKGKVILYGIAFEVKNPTIHLDVINGC